MSLHRALGRSRTFNWRQHIDSDQWQNPFFYRGLPVLNLNAIEFDYPADAHQDALYVGPMIDSRREQALSAEIDSLLSNRQGRPLVYCASGQFRASYDVATVARIIDAAKLRLDWDFIVVGRDVAAQDLPELSSNIVLAHHAPQLRCLEQADIAIVHGGIMSINECVQTQTPMLMYSLGIRDQDGDVARARHHNLGRVGSRTRDTPEDVIRVIEEVLNDSQIRKSLASMAARYDDYVKQRTLERSVRELLSGE